MKRFVSEYKEKKKSSGFVVREMAPAPIINANMQPSQMNIMMMEDQNIEEVSDAGSIKKLGSTVTSMMRH